VGLEGEIRAVFIAERGYGVQRKMFMERIRTCLGRLYLAEVGTL
jgi:hypothetical protein